MNVKQNTELYSAGEIVQVICIKEHILSGSTDLIVGNKYFTLNKRDKNDPICFIYELDGSLKGFYPSIMFCSIEDWRENQINDILK
jgi:hypothetical protein